jgi:glycosyltransferase involved in cell wall biosynthesis
MKITANIITLNEEKNIEAVIRSVAQVCDEILVVDSQSSDRTQEIAKSLGARVIIQPYLGDGPQKKVAERHASHAWVLSLDADERLDENAIAAIKALDLDATPYDAYSFRRKTFIGDRFIKLWYPDRRIRLYNIKQSAGFSEAMGHAGVVAKAPYALDADLLHYSYEDYAQMVGTIKKFSQRGAKMMFDAGKRASWYDPFTHGFSSLFKKLVLKGGMFQGVDGWSVSIISAFNTYIKYVMLLELQKDLK